MATEKQRQLSDRFSVGSVSEGSEKPESSSLSDSGSEYKQASSHSDEAYLLATSRPKKRAGRKIFKETRHPIFRGVRRRNNNKWVCELREPNKKTRIWLGTYPTPEMAARAHDVAALAFRGKLACLNFADSVWRLPVPASLDAKDIRRSAAEAAEAFKPHHEYEEVSDESSAKASGEEKSHWTQKVTFVDEEAVFGMPQLLVDMAEGLLLLPPHLAVKDDTMNWEDNMIMETDNCGDWLWSYSF